MNCADNTQNTMTEGILGGMVHQYFTSIDPLCPMQDGICFCLVGLTTDQSIALKKKQSSAVRAHLAYSYGDLRRSSSQTQRAKIPGRDDRGRLKKRDTLSIEKQDPADSSLCSLFLPSKVPNLQFDTPTSQRPADQAECMSLIRGWILLNQICDSPT